VVRVSGSPLKPAAAALLVALGLAGPGFGQTIEEVPRPGSPPPVVQYHGILPGVTRNAEVRKILGAPAHENSWYAYKMLYPAKGDPRRFDAVYTVGKDGRVGTIEAVSVPEGCDDEPAVRARLGEPEFDLILATQRMLDYSERGLRFWFDREGRTIGAAFFPHGQRRVHLGEKRRLDLSGLPQSQPAGLTGPGRPEDWRVGTAIRPISPIEKSWLPTPEWSVHDDMHARALVLTDGRTRVAIVAADLFGMNRNDFEPIEKRLTEQGWPALVVAMSHNHAAPDTIGIYGHYPAEYVRYIQKQIGDAVLEAAANLKPVVEVRVAQRELPLIGARVHGLIRNARNPGIVDPSIALVRLIGPEGRTLATLANFACHVEGLSDGWKRISADFPGPMCATVEKELGGRCLFLNGALGGMVSGDTKARTFEESAEAGREFARLLLELAAQDQPIGAYTLSFHRQRLELPVTNPRFLAFASRMKSREVIRGRLASEINLLKIGPAEVLTIPGELLPELSFEIQARMTGWPRMIVGLANDELGYIIPAYDFRASESPTMEGWTYEETMSLGPATGPVIVESAVRLLEGGR
jgi:hypothetical protein